MRREDLLHQIAMSGYIAGFGAKRSFASFEILTKFPNIVGWALLCIGVFGLIVRELATSYVSAATVCIGAITTYLSVQKRDLERLQESGEKLTAIRDELGLLYAKVRGVADGVDFNLYTTELSDFRARISQASVSDQVLFSNWFAHLKFFGEAQIHWINDELKFRLLRDKIPASLSVLVVAALVVAVAIKILICW